MRRGAVVLALLLAGLAPAAIGQVQYSINNFLRYGNGTQVISGLEKTKQYLEDQANLRLFWGDFAVGLQYQYDNPPESEVIAPYRGIRKRYAEFTREDLEIRLGDFYTLYGKGLAMNLFENRGLYLDTGLDGFRGMYHDSYLTGILAAGSFTYPDLMVPSRVQTYDVKSAHAEAAPLDALRIGGSMVGATGEIMSDFGVHTVRADIFEGMATLNLFGFDVFGEYAWKRSSGILAESVGVLTPFDGHTGDAIYASLGYAGDMGFGVILEYKNYRFDPVNPDRQNETTRPTGMLPMQNPPTAFKEHTFYLLSRNMHQIDFNDEVGFQFEAFYALAPTVTLNANVAASSRQYAYTPLALGAWKKVRRDNELLPSFDNRFSPFYEIYGEVEWYFSGQSFLRAAFNRRYDVTYYAYIHKASVQASTTIPLRVEYTVNDDYSIGASFEQQFYHDTKSSSVDYYNEYITLALAKASMWAASLRMEFTTDDDDPSGKSSWYVGEVTYKLGTVHTAILSYGTERGGLVCSNGICRVVNPFDGVRFALSTQL